MTATRTLVGSTVAPRSAIERLFFYGNAFAAFAKSCELPWIERRPKQRQLGQGARRLRRLFEGQLLAARRSASAYPVGSTEDASAFESIQTIMRHVEVWSDRLDMFVAKWRAEPVSVGTLPPDFVAVLTVEPANLIAPLPARTRRTKKEA